MSEPAAEPAFLALGMSPALDAVVGVDRLPRTGDVIRAAGAPAFAPGGKALNAARHLAARGRTVALGGLVGADDAAAFAAELRARGVRDAMLRVPGPVRRNATFVSPGGGSFKLNAPAFPALRAEDWDGERVLGALLGAFPERPAGAPAVALLCGSLPRAVPPDFLARAVRRLAAAGAAVAVDASGAALRAALGAEPDLAKPNREECEELLGFALRDEADFLRALRELLRFAPRAILTDGAAACWFAERGEGPENPRVWRAAPPAVAEADPTGAGDALLAEFCHRQDPRAPLSEDAMRHAVAAGAAAAARRGAEPAPAADVESLAAEVRLERVLRPSGAA